MQAHGCGRQLFVGSLPWTVCRDTLREYFQQFGKVSFTTVVYDYYNGRSKRFGYVEFESLESQQKALETERHFIEGAKVVVQLRQTGEPGRRNEDRGKNFTEV